MKRQIASVTLSVLVAAFPVTAYAQETAGAGTVLPGWVGGMLAVLALVLALGAYVWARRRPE